MSAQNASTTDTNSEQIRKQNIKDSLDPKSLEKKTREYEKAKEIRVEKERQERLKKEAHNLAVRQNALFKPTYAVVSTDNIISQEKRSTRSSKEKTPTKTQGQGNSITLSTPAKSTSRKQLFPPPSTSATTTTTTTAPVYSMTPPVRSPTATPLHSILQKGKGRKDKKSSAYGILIQDMAPPSRSPTATPLRSILEKGWVRKAKSHPRMGYRSRT
jgi:hypothetical protein